MAGPAKSRLEARCGAAAETARTAVAHAFALEVLDKTDADYPKTGPWREVWRVAVQVAGQQRVLLCAVPFAFPSQFPKILLRAADLKELGELPHINRDRVVCTFDDDSVQINADRPADLALAVIRRAASILEAGVLGSNAGDYGDELGAYWERVAERRTLSLVRPGGVIRTVKLLRLKPHFKMYSRLFAETKGEGDEWLANVGHDPKYCRWEEALYLPSSSLGTPPFPATNAELVSALAREDSQNLEALYGFLTGRVRPCAVLSSVETGSGTVMVAWEHLVYSHSVQGRSGSRTVRGPVPGFRPGNCPPDLELTKLNGAGEFLRMSVERVDAARLFRRTTGQELEGSEREAAVVGCGSLGSFVADGLIRAGIAGSLTLVDPQTLGPENVWRHLCGMRDVGSFKTKAVSASLRHHFPHTRIRTYERNVLDLMMADEGKKLARCSPVVHTVGVLAVDREMNELCMRGELGAGPLCLMWVEPGLIAGHALLVLPHQPGCFECLLSEDDLRFSERAILEPGDLGVREPGCQSSYQPYGVVDLNSFVAGAVRFLARHLRSQQSLRYSWYGDLGTARARGLELHDRLATFRSHSEEVVPIPPTIGCPVCQPNYTA